MLKKGIGKVYKIEYETGNDRKPKIIEITKWWYDRMINDLLPPALFYIVKEEGKWHGYDSYSGRHCVEGDTKEDARDKLYDILVNVKKEHNLNSFSDFKEYYKLKPLVDMFKEEMLKWEGKEKE